MNALVCSDHNLHQFQRTSCICQQSEKDTLFQMIHSEKTRKKTRTLKCCNQVFTALLRMAQLQKSLFQCATLFYMFFTGAYYTSSSVSISTLVSSGVRESRIFLLSDCAGNQNGWGRKGGSRHGSFVTSGVFH